LQQHLTKVYVVHLHELLATNEVWAMALLDKTPEMTDTAIAPDLQLVLTKFDRAFYEPATLPPWRALDHATLQASTSSAGSIWFAR
jgi:hypothetical protein